MEVTSSKWKGADAAFERGQQAYLDWCREIAKLYAEGDATQEEIAGRYGKDQTSVSRCIAVGTDKRIMYSIHKLPKSTKVLYELTTLPDKDFEELCKPTTTQAVILEHKRRLAAPPPKVESEKERLDRLNVAECFRPGYQQKSTLVAPPEPPKADPRQWLLNYVRGCSEENLLTLLERVRSIEHPDRGGSHQISTEVNDLIRRIKDDN